MYDLIIIGTGSMGAAGAYYASLKGLKVLMMDAHHPPHDHGMHHGATRLYRYVYHNDAYQRLLNRAAQLWPALEKRHQVKLLERCGVLNLAPADSANLLAKREMADLYHLPYEWLSPTDIQARWAGFAVPENYCGLYENDAGYVYSEKAVELFVQEAEQQGAHSAFGSAVTRVNRDDEGLIVFNDKGESYRARKVAVCAGTWANAIAGLRFKLAFTPVRKTFAWYDAPQSYQQARGFPGFTVESADGMYYGFPDHGEGLKVGRHDAGEVMQEASERYPYGHYASDREDTDQFLHTFMPQVDNLRDGKVCSYDRTANEDFIIGRHPDDPAIMLLSGFSGHGFKFVPAIGEWIAMFAANERLPEHIAFFDPYREDKQNHQ